MAAPVAVTVTTDVVAVLGPAPLASAGARPGKQARSEHSDQPCVKPR
jgi:hypothetical protein